MSELRVSTETVCFLIAKARAFDVKVPPSELNDGADPIDDDFVEALEDSPASDATEEELRRALEALNGAELADVVALMWLGREATPAESWEEVLQQVGEARIDHPVDYLMGTPLLGDYLEEGLAQMGRSCADSGETLPPGRKLLPA
jgi:hypothetical protein